MGVNLVDRRAASLTDRGASVITMLHLRPEDEFLLLAHSARTPMQIGALLRYGAPEGPTMPGSFVERAHAHLSQRLLATALAQRLVPSPGHYDTDAWFGLAALDIDRLVRVAPQSHPMTADELHELVATEAKRELDLSGGPFRVLLVESLADGGSAMLLQVHHTLCDGVGFQSIVTALSDPTPVPTDRPPLFAVDEAVPDDVSWIAQSDERFAREVEAARPALEGRAAAKAALAEFNDDPDHAPLRAPRIGALVGPTSPRRSYDTLTLSLSEVRDMGRALGGTVNDVFLTVAGGALRSYLVDRGIDIPDEPMIALGSRSYRRPEHGDLGNYIIGIRPALGTHLADPRERLAAVKASAAIERRRSELQEPLMRVPDGPFKSRDRRERSANRGERGDQRLGANVVLSNVPGPAETQWLAGFRQISNHPAPILGTSMLLNITLRRYGDSLDLGVMTDASKVPSAHAVSDHVRLAFAALRAALSYP